MNVVRSGRRLGVFAGALWLCATGPQAMRCQTPGAAAIVAKIDQSAQTRQQRLDSYTVTEHYAVYRGNDQSKPAAEMTVKTTYKRETGKSYEVVSESGSELVRRFGLHSLLENERAVNQPGTRERSWFTSANYQMQPLEGTQAYNGRECVVLNVSPKRRAPNLLNGKLWVDARDGAIVRIEGVSTKNPSLLSGPVHMTRDYTLLEGLAVATRAQAETNSFFLGRIVVTIDYSDYKLQLAGGR